MIGVDFEALSMGSHPFTFVIKPILLVLVELDQAVLGGSEITWLDVGEFTAVGQHADIVGDLFSTDRVLDELSESVLRCMFDKVLFLDILGVAHDTGLTVIHLFAVGALRIVISLSLLCIV